MLKRINKKIRTVYFFINSVILFLLHIPFVFAKSAGVKLRHTTGDNNPVVATTGIDFSSNTFIRHLHVFDSLQLELHGLSKQVFELAVKGLERLKTSGISITDNIISIADFSQPSSHKRLYVIDLNNYSLLFNTYVAHGQNSGEEYARRFSNRPKSFQSSPGFYITMDTYLGSNGYSLKLNGVEKGINNNALRRDIVMHGAPYVNENLISQQGYIGRSWGCPAVPLGEHRQIIETIKNGTCLFIYPGQTNYLQQSTVLN